MTLKCLIALFLALFAFFSIEVRGDIVALTTPSQAKKELSLPGPRIVLYYTDWCPYCHQFMPEYLEASNENPGVRFYVMNLDHIRLKEHRVNGIPQIYAGISDKDLRNTPCIGGSPKYSMMRTASGVKAFLRQCIKDKRK